MGQRLPDCSSACSMACHSTMRWHCRGMALPGSRPQCTRSVRALWPDTLLYLYRLWSACEDMRESRGAPHGCREPAGTRELRATALDACARGWVSAAAVALGRRAR